MPRISRRQVSKEVESIADSAEALNNRLNHLAQTVKLSNANDPLLDILDDCHALMINMFRRYLVFEKDAIKLIF